MVVADPPTRQHRDPAGDTARRRIMRNSCAVPTSRPIARGFRTMPRRSARSAAKRSTQASESGEPSPPRRRSRRHGGSNTAHGAGEPAVPAAGGASAAVPPHLTHDGALWCARARGGLDSELQACLRAVTREEELQQSSDEGVSGDHSAMWRVCAARFGDWVPGTRASNASLSPLYLACRRLNPHAHQHHREACNDTCAAVRRLLGWYRTLSHEVQRGVVPRPAPYVPTVGCDHEAARHTHEQHVYAACKAGNYADILDGRGRSAVFAAASRGYLNVVKILAEEHGGSLDVMDHDGDTALNYAIDRGHEVRQWVAWPTCHRVGLACASRWLVS